MHNKLCDLETIWRSLNNGSVLNGWSLLNLGDFPAGNVFAGRHFPDNTESIIVVFPCQNLSDIFKFPRGKGFNVFPFVDSKLFSGTGIALCRTPAGSIDLFRKIVLDILDLLDQNISVDNVKIAKMLVDRILAWQKFMEKPSETCLTSAQEIGLWGELEFIKRTIAAGVSPVTVINSWRGPFGDSHDFAFGSSHVEVKTTASDKGFLVNIGSFDQLEAPSNGVIYLQAFHLNTENGNTLPDQVAEVIQLLQSSQESLGEFHTRLIQVGYQHDDEAKYTQTFHVVSPPLFLVNEEFPCLRRNTTPETIVLVSYTLDISRISCQCVALEHFCQEVINGIE